MASDDERDYAEETYNRNLCPGCEHSPCIGDCEAFAQAAAAERGYERFLETNLDYRDEVFADIRRSECAW